MPPRRTALILTCLLFLFVRAASAQSQQGYPRLMQGPMIGAVHPERVLLWARTSGPFPVRAELALDAGFEQIVARTEAVTTKADDYCVTLELGGLSPDSPYFARVLVNGVIDRYARDTPPIIVRTAPAGPARFRLAMGSCARYSLDRVQPIWRVVGERSPDLFFWLGDNIYGDALDSDILAEEYRRQRDLATFQPVMRRVPQLATWDDHDFGLNDRGGTHPAKADALDVFKRYWPNGAHGTPDTPGVFFDYTYGGVDFFMLDGRYHRSENNEPDGEHKHLLGPAQHAWLMDRLRASTAPFKLLVCGSGWTLQKGPTGDSWSAFKTARDRLFADIIDRGIQGVVLVSGDTHLGELNVIRLSERGGYDVYELVSSPLAQRPNAKDRPMIGSEARVRPGYRLSPNVGLIDFDMEAEDPTLTFTLVDVWGRDVWDPFVLRASDLVMP